MIGKNRYFNTKFWDDPWIVELDNEEKLLFIYLITNSLTNVAGIYEITKRKISFDTGLSVERLSKAFEGFEELSKAFYYEGCNYMYIPNVIKHQKLNGNIIKGIETIINNLPSSFWDEMGKASKGFQRLSKALNYFNLNINLNTNLNIKVKTNLPQKSVGQNNFLEGFSEEFLKAFESFSKMRESINKKLTEDSSRILIQKLHSLSGFENDKIKILNNSTVGCYPDIYPLRNEKTKQTPVVESELSEDECKRIEIEILTEAGNYKELKRRGYITEQEYNVAIK